MLKKLIPAMAIFCVICAPQAYGVEIAGVRIPDTLSVDSHTLVLNGAGLRTKWFFKIYAAGLYLTHKTQNPDQIIDENEPMAIRLHMIYGGVTSEDMTDAMKEGFEKATDGDTAPIESRIQTFNSFFMEPIKKNDIFDLIYIPDKGLEVLKNGNLKGTIPGLDFKKAAFAIWLGREPADSGLKEGMLGEN